MIVNGFFLVLIMYHSGTDGTKVHPHCLLCTIESDNWNCKSTLIEKREVISNE